MCCGPRPLLDGSVFVAREIVTRVGFTAATGRLANLLTGNTLQNASRSAYGDGLTALIPVGPAPGLTRLVRAQFRDLVVRDDTAVLTVRWEPPGPAPALFPVLDADITLTPAGDNATLLRLDGSYRPPLGAAGAIARPGRHEPGGFSHYRCPAPADLRGTCQPAHLDRHRRGTGYRARSRAGNGLAPLAGIRLWRVNRGLGGWSN